MGYSEHWWCTAPDGTIVDPTASQFEGFALTYLHLMVRDVPTLPTGKCMDCGEYLYYDAQFCDAKCERLTAEYLGMPIGVNTRFNPDESTHPRFDIAEFIDRKR